MRAKSLFFLFALQLAFNSDALSQQKDSSGIYVSNVEFDMLTMVSVSCERFGSSFPTRMKHNHIEHSDSLLMLDSFLEKVKYSKRNRGIDVRGQVNYFKPGHARITICMNRYDIMVNGRLIKQNERFKDFLRSMTR